MIGLKFITYIFIFLFPNIIRSLFKTMMILIIVLNIFGDMNNILNNINI
jgi:hypothetical protein